MILGVTDKEQRIIEDILDAYADNYSLTIRLQKIYMK